MLSEWGGPDREPTCVVVFCVSELAVSVGVDVTGYGLRAIYAVPRPLGLWILVLADMVYEIGVQEHEYP